ncbi:MAG: carbonic anhydrase family protein [Hydrogenophaga sp.]|uniref:carbonic anhydrase n=1 Tax=Hydrogenophaga sp. TaxID=1904254 RepID=UPI00262CBB46|nr:carbonic anhydrase family protein [Hydrogenophaga sp.]MDM7942421.1 carbonic anhydrase family protein [Hydrogenophaga sp.]
MTFNRPIRTPLLFGALLCALANLTHAAETSAPTLTLSAPGARPPPAVPPGALKPVKPLVAAAGQEEVLPKARPVAKNAAAPTPAAPAGPDPAAVADDAVGSNEALRKLLVERIAGSGEIVLRSSDVEPAKPRRAPAKPKTALTPADLAAVQRLAHAPEGHGHWSHSGPDGPQAWGKLQPGYELCAKGQRQSPIDIHSGIQVKLDPIGFDYRSGAFKVLDNGHTIQVTPARGSSIEVMGKRYDLVQFHFHRPSEERMDGRSFDMVLHLVHKDLDGRLAVLAVLLTEGQDHPEVQLVWNNWPLERQQEVAASAALDLNKLLPEDRRYVTYMGSLTTPPCTEGVLWMVLKSPVQISSEQIATFAHLYPMNARPIQPSNGRLIKEDR